jgi:hypothetical protein
MNSAYDSTEKTSTLKTKYTIIKRKTGQKAPEHIHQK